MKGLVDLASIKPSDYKIGALPLLGGVEAD
jgi:hypothetical protein